MKIISTLFLTFSLSITYAQIQVSTLVNNIDASGGLKVDAAGNIIMADFGESLDNGNGTNVYKVSPTGEISLFATGLAGASGNALDSQGNLFQSNIQAGHVSKITPDGTVSTFTTNGISCNVGIAIDPDDNLYICNCCGTFANTIRKVTPTGVSTPFASGSLFNCPNGITIDDNNNLYVSNFSNGNIVKITPDGTPTLFARTPGANGNAPSNGHIVYAPQEQVFYVASHGAHQIFRVDMEGNIELFAGTSSRGNRDGAALEATFSRPNGLAISVTGDTLYLNSSIPLTNANGRPLNPSRLRMITGLLNTTTTNDLSILANIHIYPNPTHDFLNIQLQSSTYENLNISLLNTNGQVVQNIKNNQDFITNSSIELSLEDLPKGIYYLFFDGGVWSGVRKVMVW